ncbi:poly(ethylene terephthalate) hydrolase family protein [Anaerosporobacter faecicola]|uniref:poly(ethylene terephthalate) hydrolase family protein n=1 Tax=Anaerosporobacter faecicola TaxID=2718714 RepID=UPI001438AE66|nr:magnesium transporter [Anaerosporobacter faecicola]
MEKKRNWFGVKHIYNKCKQGVKRFLAYWNRNFADTYKGFAILSILLTGVGFAAAIRAYVSMLPAWICFSVGIVLTGLILFLLHIGCYIVFGGKRKGVFYCFFPILLLFSYASLASQGSSMGVSFFASVSIMILVDLCGRSIWALLRKKRHTITILCTLILTVVSLGGVGYFLGFDGFEDGYVREYLQYKKAEEPKDKTQVPTGFDASIAVGEKTVQTVEYGVEKSCDLPSTTYNLSSFAKRTSLTGWGMDKYFGNDLAHTPIAGRVWYPEEDNQCPVLFIVHGNHNYTTPSYEGYAYLGEYLASQGYVVVSVDENYCNELSDENDGRAVLLLENMKKVLSYNEQEGNILYQKIDPSKIAIAGHSRGGECVSTAYLFNQYDTYPENGNIKFSYHYSIKAILSIAQTVDQYMPAQHEVALQDVNYLLLHGANDQDVTTVMGNKQYKNISYSGNKDCFKSILYIGGANHGQFNSEWGQYDSAFPNKYFLNTENLIPEEQQQEILKIFAKTYLDVTLKEDKTYESLFSNYEAYETYLPETLYQQTYSSSRFDCVSNFDEDSNLETGTMDGVRIATEHTSLWREVQTPGGYGGTGENHAIRVDWRNTEEAKIKLTIPTYDARETTFQFDLADLEEERKSQPQFLGGSVTLVDGAGEEAMVSIRDCATVYPSLPVQLYKVDYLFDLYEYKHQFQTVRMGMSKFEENNPKFDPSKIVKIVFTFHDRTEGKIKIDNVGFER